MTKTQQTISDLQDILRAYNFDFSWQEYTTICDAIRLLGGTP